MCHRSPSYPCMADWGNCVARKCGLVFCLEKMQMDPLSKSTNLTLVKAENTTKEKWLNISGSLEWLTVKPGNSCWNVFPIGKRKPWSQLCRNMFHHRPPSTMTTSPPIVDFKMLGFVMEQLTTRKSSSLKTVSAPTQLRAYGALSRTEFALCTALDMNIYRIYWMNSCTGTRQETSSTNSSKILRCRARSCCSLRTFLNFKMFTFLAVTMKSPHLSEWRAVP